MKRPTHVYVVFDDHEPKVVCFTEKAVIAEISRITPAGVEVYKVPVSKKSRKKKS